MDINNINIGNISKVMFLPLIILIILIWFVKTSNRLNRYQVIIKESKRNLDIAISKRYDTLCQMIKVAKSFARHEKTTFSEIIKLRQGSDIKDLDKTIKIQDKTIDRIYALAESYPELRSSDEFLRIQDEIDDENEQLAAAKRIVNNNISIINQEVVTFPTSIVAGLKGLKQLDFLEEDDLTRKKSIDDFDYDI